MAGAKILIVEDENVVALDLQKRLQALGYAIAGAAATGPDAIRQAAAASPDLVLMDIRLRGEMSGIEAAVQINSRLDVPVIYFSDEATLQQARATTPYGYLVKPFKDHDLRLAIEVALEKHRADRAARQRDRQALEASEERYRMLVDSLRDVIFTLAPDGTIDSLNAAFEAATALPRAEFIGRHLSEFLAPDQLPAAQEMLQRVLAGERLPPFELSMPDAHGRLMTAELVLVPIMHEGRVTGILGSARDVTERRQAEAALLRERQTLHLIISSMPNALLRLDEQDCVHAYYAPAHLLRALELPEAALGQPISEVLPDEGLHAALCAALQAAHSSQNVQAFEHALMRNGQPLHLSVRVSPVRGSREMLVMLDDITLLKQAEQAEREQRTLAEALRDTAAALNSTLKIDEVLDRVLDSLERVMPHDAASILLLDDNEARVVRQRGYAERGTSSVLASLRFPLAEFENLRTMVLTKQPLILPDVNNYPGWVDIEGFYWQNSQAGAPILIGGEVAGFICLDSATPGFFKPERAGHLQALADQAGTAIQNARLFDAIERRGRYLETLRRVSRRAVPVRSREMLLQAVTRGLVEDFGCAYAGIFLLDEGRQNLILEMEASSELLAPNIGVAIPISRGICGWVATHNQPRLVSEVEREPRYVPIPGLNTRSDLAVPIRQHGQVIGVLNIEALERAAFDEMDQQALLELADELSLNLENVELNEQAQAAAAQAERQRLARDLHDAVSQTLFSASVIAEMLPRLYKRNPEAIWPNLAQLQRLIRGAMAEMRTLLLELRPAAIVETDLGILLGQLADGFSGRTSTAIELSVEGPNPLPPDVQVALYRIAQEALNNIIKHARATRVTVHLTNQPGHVALHISDNGRGFDLGAIPPNHFGLHIMRERAKGIGADFAISSSPQAGTAIAVEWPGSQEGRHTDGAAEANPGASS